jgi:hypothetical protein
MLFDMGPLGLGILVFISLAFGAVVQLIASAVMGRSASGWLWLVGAIGWFIGGLVMSEIVFATATNDEIQPIIDGLALDESALGGLVVGLAAVLTPLLSRRERRVTVRRATMGNR